MSSNFKPSDRKKEDLSLHDVSGQEGAQFNQAKSSRGVRGIPPRFGGKSVGPSPNKIPPTGQRSSHVTVNKRG